MIKIMFVCTGNTCRSAIAECVLKFILRRDGIEGIIVSSCGLDVRETTMNIEARAALNRLGIKPRKFLPKQASAKLISKQNAVVCMTEAQKNRFIDFNNIYTLGELTGIGDVPDPYGQSANIYDKTATAIFSACEKLVSMLTEK